MSVRARLCVRELVFSHYFCAHRVAECCGELLVWFLALFVLRDQRGACARGGLM